jgi:hypothetical protein
MTHLLTLLAGCAVLLLALPSHAAPDPLAQSKADHDAQIVGWSADETRFAIRLYLRDTFATRQFLNDPIPCEGYVNHEGNTFLGGVVLLVYERGKLLHHFPIRDTDRCTPPDEASKRIDKATKRLTAMGINLHTPGTQIVSTLDQPRISVEQGPQAPYTIEYEAQAPAADAPPKNGRLQGTSDQALYVRKGDTRAKVLSRKAAYDYSPAMAGYWRPGLDRVVLSPSGNTLIVLGNERTGNMSGSRKSLRLLGVLRWSGTTLKPL